MTQSLGEVRPNHREFLYSYKKDCIFIGTFNFATCQIVHRSESISNVIKTYRIDSVYMGMTLACA